MTETSGAYEARLERLKDIVARLERGDLPLEEGVSLYKEGLSLAKECRERLMKAKNEISVFQDGLLVELAQDAGSGGEGAGK